MENTLAALGAIWSSFSDAERIAVAGVVVAVLVGVPRVRALPSGGPRQARRGPGRPAGAVPGSWTEGTNRLSA